VPGAHLAEGVEALGDGGGVHEVARADLAGDHLVDLANINLVLPRLMILIVCHPGFHWLLS